MYQRQKMLFGFFFEFRKNESLGIINVCVTIKNIE